MTTSTFAGTRRIVVPSHIEMVDLLGEQDAVLREVESGFPSVNLLARGNIVAIAGPAQDVAVVTRLLEELIEVVDAGTQLSPEVVRRSVAMLAASFDGSAAWDHPSEVLTHNILSSRGRNIRPKTAGQKRYVDAIDANTITFGVGPAGTGKTYLAMAKAVAALQANEVGRIILSRPAVEAGEKLGFLPGTLSDKIDPYLRPLFDALAEMIDPATIPKLIEAGTVEVAPLAFLRGRSLNDAFIILDEAQNTTSEQMKMFLTRLGFRSRMVVTGDATQVDLPGGVPSGLRVVRDILIGVDDVEFIDLTSADVVRHRLVGEIIEAYARWDVVKARAPMREPNERTKR